MSAPTTPPLYLAWLEKAEHDRAAIRGILVVQPTPWDTVCFHAQQAAEKILKAFLVFHGLQPQRTHDCERLLRDCVPFDAALAALFNDCTLLSDYGVNSRYPDVGVTPDSVEAADALAAMERVRAAVLALLPT